MLRLKHKDYKAKQNYSLVSRLQTEKTFYCYGKIFSELPLSN